MQLGHVGKITNKKHILPVYSGALNVVYRSVKLEVVVPGKLDSLKVV